MEGNDDYFDDDYLSDDANENYFGEADEEMQHEKDSKYEILDDTELMDFMNKTIERVSSAIPIPPSSIQILLHHFKWDEEKLLLKFYDDDQEKLFQDASISNPFKEGNVVRSCGSEEECLICCEYHPVSEMSCLGCEHQFCNDCWSKYLENKILDEGMGENITCAAHFCTIFMDNETCLRLLRNSRAEEVYKTIIMNGFVTTNPHLQWCAGPSCTYAIKNIDLEEEELIVCKCGATTCFTCGNNWHFPMRCSFSMKWLKLSEDYALKRKFLTTWITLNTKECPNCNIYIEKIGGCNHMTCKNRNCRYEFCWLCMGDYLTHKSCSRVNFTVKGVQYWLDDLRSESGELQRFLFHYNRYAGHKISLELEQQLHESVNDKMKNLIESGIPSTDLQFLTKGLDILRQCRTTLMYTYPFKYYLEENNEAIIFSSNQSDLHNATEMLSGYLESNIRTDKFSDIKKNVKNLQIYCENRRKALEAHVLEGFEEDMWKYQDP